MALAFNIFLGLTLSVSDYSKSIDYSYESIKPESYGFSVDYNLTEDYFFQLDFKRLAAQVQSSSGFLNIYGWDYTHDLTYLKFGYNLNTTESIYIAPMIYYVPTLFPISVGALTSEAAFEKTLSVGLGFGYVKEIIRDNFKFKLDSSLSITEFLSQDYDHNYSFLFDVDMNPSWKVAKKMYLGVNYNLVAGQTSLTEKKTGSNFPFRSTYFLHNLFLTFTYTLH